jgi:ABC-2 type transport system permease protein
VAFCGALAFGSLFYSIFSEVLSESAWGMLFFVLLCGFLSYLAAEMLLQKSFRVLKNSWRGCVVMLLVLVVATAAMEFDITGYERRVPDADEVESVTLSSISSMPYDSARSNGISASDTALIARIASLHASTVQNKAAVEKGFRDYEHTNIPATLESGISVETMNSVGFDLLYTLTDGQEVSRSYTIPVTAELLADPSSPAALLLDILNRREDLADSYFPETVTSADFIAGTVSFYGSTESGRYDETALTAAIAGILNEAAMEDFAVGGLGRRYLLQDTDYYTQVFQNEITLTCYGIFPGWTSGAQAQSVDIMLYPQADSVHLIAALEELGILDGEHTLVTQLELSAAEKGYYKQ